MKRWAWVILMILALTACGCAWMWQNHPRTLPAQSAKVIDDEPDALTRFRTEREQLRQRQRAELNDIIHDAKTDPETLGLAQRQLIRLTAAEDTEVQLEGLLSARGFEGVVVSASEAAVNVLVRREALTRQETAVILDLVLRQTGISGGNVKIIPLN